MTDPDYRALCAELVDALAEQDRCWMLINDARAALAQPEPMAPTDDELWEAYDQMDGVPEDWPWCRVYARAVLAKWGHQ
jgi:hypothetical protein